MLTFYFTGFGSCVTGDLCRRHLLGDIHGGHPPSGGAVHCLPGAAEAVQRATDPTVLCAPPAVPPADGRGRAPGAHTRGWEGRVAERCGARMAECPGRVSWQSALSALLTGHA
eukprot:2169473-Pyramimonas_sp.AAC.1